MLALSGSTAASGGSTAAGDFEPSTRLCITATGDALDFTPAVVPPPLAEVPLLRVLFRAVGGLKCVGR